MCPPAVKAVRVSPGKRKVMMDGTDYYYHIITAVRRLSPSRILVIFPTPLSTSCLRVFHTRATRPVLHSIHKISMAKALALNS